MADNFFWSTSTPDLRPAIVLEFGRRFTKIGLAGECRPRFLLSTGDVISFTTRVEERNAIDFEFDRPGGDVAAVTATTSVREWIFRLQPLLDRILFLYLKTNPVDRKIVLLEPVLPDLMMPLYLLEEDEEENLDLQLTAGTSGKISTNIQQAKEAKPPQAAVVIDVGHFSTRILPVFAGVPILTAYREIRYGGCQVTEKWARNLRRVVGVRAGIRDVVLDPEDAKLKFGFVRYGDLTLLNETSAGTSRGPAGSTSTFLKKGAGAGGGALLGLGSSSGGGGGLFDSAAAAAVFPMHSRPAAAEDKLQKDKTASAAADNAVFQAMLAEDGRRWAFSAQNSSSAVGAGVTTASASSSSSPSPSANKFSLKCCLPQESCFEKAAPSVSGRGGNFDMSIIDAFWDAVDSAPIDVRKHITQKIVVVGGQSMAVGFLPRLAQELDASLDVVAPRESGFKIGFPRLDAVPPLIRTWVGGSLAACVEDEMAYSIADYRKGKPIPDWCNGPII
eukprot:g11711.t1